MSWDDRTTDIRGYALLLTFVVLDVVDAGIVEDSCAWGVTLTRDAAAKLSAFAENRDNRDAMAWLADTRLGSPHLLFDCDAINGHTRVNLQLVERALSGTVTDRLLLTITATLWKSTDAPINSRRVDVDIRHLGGDDERAHHNSAWDIAWKERTKGAFCPSQTGYPEPMATAPEHISPPSFADIDVILRTHEVELRSMGVLSLAVFGSVVHGDAAPGSDVDLLVELEGPAGLLRYAHLENHIADLLGCSVDLIPKSALRPEIRDRILSEATRVI